MGDKNKEHGKSLSVPLLGQRRNHTCGSACGTMILRLFGVDGCSEEDFWDHADANGEGTYVYRVCAALNHFLGADQYRYVYAAGMDLDAFYQLIYASLEQGCPVEVVLKIPDGSAFGYTVSGHYVLITGVYQDTDGEYVAEINDPFSPNWRSNGHQGQQIEVKLSHIRQYNKSHSGYIICH